MTRDDAARPDAFDLLTVAPAVVRISVTGKDTTKELDSLAAVVAKPGFPSGVSTERVLATASEMARLIKVESIGCVTSRTRKDLTPAAKCDAVRLALLAIFISPVRGSADIGFLGRMAAEIGMCKAAFDALCEAAGAMA